MEAYVIETTEMEEKKRRDEEERMHIHVAKLHEMKVMEIVRREHEVDQTKKN